MVCLTHSELCSGSSSLFDRPHPTRHLVNRVIDDFLWYLPSDLLSSLKHGESMVLRHLGSCAIVQLNSIPAKMDGAIRTEVQNRMGETHLQQRCEWQQVG